jgi:hypothetical protein
VTRSDARDFGQVLIRRCGHLEILAIRSSDHDSVWEWLKHSLFSDLTPDQGLAVASEPTVSEQSDRAHSRYGLADRSR